MPGTGTLMAGLAIAGLLASFAGGVYVGTNTTKLMTTGAVLYGGYYLLTHK